MSLYLDYRKRIKSLLAADDIQKTLEVEGMSSPVAIAVSNSRAVLAQRSLGKKLVHDIAEKCAERNGSED